MDPELRFFNRSGWPWVHNEPKPLESNSFRSMTKQYQCQKLSTFPFLYFRRPGNVAHVSQKTFCYLWRFYSLLFRGFFVVFSWLFRGPMSRKTAFGPFSLLFRGFFVAFSWPPFWANFTRIRPGTVFTCFSIIQGTTRRAALEMFIFMFSRQSRHLRPQNCQHLRTSTEAPKPGLKKKDQDQQLSTQTGT